MKKTIFIFYVLLSSNIFSQIPDGYYDSATGSGYELKTQLFNIINNHNDQGYNSLDNFYINNDLDIYYENDNTILDIYSENPTNSDPYNFNPNNDACGNYSSEGDCYNKEHIIPQSVFDTNYPMRSDAHHVLPADGRVNGFRGNYPFGIVGSNLISQSGITNPTLNGTKLGYNLNDGDSSGYSGVVFEPIDEFKGDIARIYFYFITRYENVISTWSDYAMFDGSSNKVLDDTFLNILYSWHISDPVSQKEIDRNNQIYLYQDNRNPFIDNPTYVNQIWNISNDNENPSTPSNISIENVTSSSILINWEASTDNIAVASYSIFIDGNFYFSTDSTSFLITNLTAQTNYCISIQAVDQSQNISELSEEVCDTTLDQSNETSEIFISEYIEGSSNNKAIELANFTGEQVSLDNYSLARNTNSGGIWGEFLQLNGIVNNEDVFVVSKGNADQSIIDIADQLSSADAMSFNGDDPVGLFKDGVLIDIFGNFNGENDFANATFLRNDDIINPSTSFNINEWSVLENNTFEFLGFHNQNLDNQQYSGLITKIFPNPTNLKYFTIKSSKIFSYQLYNLNGQIKSNGNSTGLNTIVDCSNINSGFYFLRLNFNKSNHFQKIIIN